MDNHAASVAFSVRAFAVCFLFASILPTSASAQTTTYTYTGNAFRFFNSTGNVLLTCPPICRLTGSYTTAQPIPANFNGFVAYQDFTVTDGLTTINSRTPPGLYPVRSLLFVLTNAQGQIVSWHFVVYNTDGSLMFESDGDPTLGSVDFTFYPGPGNPDASTGLEFPLGIWNRSCQVTVPHSWKQRDFRWAQLPYNQSYTTKVPPPGSPSNLTAAMQLTDGVNSCPIAGVRDLEGLRNFINAECLGVNATGPRKGESYISVYDIRCLYADCYPRTNNILELRTTPGNPHTNILVPKTISAKGCALTSLAMALDFANTPPIPTNASPVNLDPDSLNDFMSNTLFGLPFIGGSFSEQGDVGFPDTTDFMFLHTGKLLDFDAFQSNSLYTQDAAYNALDNALCSSDPHPVIVGVKLGLDTSTKKFSVPNHYVLVTGKLPTPDPYLDGRMQYSIEDPAQICSPLPCTLDDYLVLTQPAFVTRGIVYDPAGDRSKLSISGGEIVQILLQDQNGLRTGFEPQTSADLNEIPSSVYFRDAVEDDITAEPSTTTTHSVHTYRPAPGSYKITTTGIGLGAYRIVVRAYSQDGGAQPLVLLQGVAGPGSTSSFQINYVSSTGAASEASRIATFQSTLADISNSLQIGLIDNHGIANSLSMKIKAASNATGPAKSNILNAFKNEVNAQSGKHISGVAPDLLLEDADSLISQLP